MDEEKEFLDKELQKKEQQERELQQRQYKKMTQEKVGALLVRLSIPTILSMMVTNIYNIVDTGFVGTLGTSESAATGIVFGYMAILQAIAFMCGQGAGSIMSRRLGEKKLNEATEYTSTGFFLSFFIGAVIAIISFIFLKPLLYALGSTETILPYAGTYIFYILLSAPFFTSSLTMNNLLRYEGRAKLGTVGLMTGAILNICGDAVFMFVLKLGIAGAGLSTAISQFISFSILLSMFLRGKTQTKISFKYITRDIRVVWNVAATGFPSLLRQGLNSIATMMLNGQAGIYGDEAVAAMSIVGRISFFAVSLALGIGQGFQPICSFNYGAKLKSRVRKAFYLAIAGGETVIFLISIPIFVFAPFWVQLLRNDPKVIELGTRALRLMCVGQLCIPFTMMVEMGFQSTGAKLMASIASSLRSGFIFIPTLVILSKLRGMNGVQEAQPLSFLISFVVCIYLSKLFMKRVAD